MALRLLYIRKAWIPECYTARDPTTDARVIGRYRQPEVQRSERICPVHNVDEVEDECTSSSGIQRLRLTCTGYKESLSASWK